MKKINIKTIFTNYGKQTRKKLKNFKKNYCKKTYYDVV